MLQERPSLESIDKLLGTNDKGKEGKESKEDKKRKDKKPGMLSGLFKRKDKKSKTSEDEPEEQEKLSSDTSRSSPPPKTSLESMSSPESLRSSKSPAGPSRQSSKLQKQPPEAMSPTKRDPQHDSTANEAMKAAEGAAMAKGIRQVVSDDGDEDFIRSPQSRSSEDTRDMGSSPPNASNPFKDPSPAETNTGNSMTSPIEANNRLWQEAFGGKTAAHPSEAPPPPKSQQSQGTEYQSRGLESPVDVSPVDQTPSGAPALMMDSSPEKHSYSPVSPPSSPGDDTNAPRVDERTSASPTTPTWSDASLRSYLDDDNDIRDLFIIVHDKSNVPPAGPDHPITGSLFKEESKRLKEMTGKLDYMLADWVNRRAQSQATK